MLKNKLAKEGENDKLKTKMINHKISSALQIDKAKQIFSIRQIAIDRNLVIAWAQRYYEEPNFELLSDDSLYVLGEIINSKEHRSYYNDRWRDVRLEELLIEFARTIELELPIGKDAIDLYLFAELTELCQLYHDRLNSASSAKSLYLDELEKDNIREKISKLESESFFPEWEYHYRWISDFGTMRYYSWKEKYDVHDLEDDISLEYHQEIPALFLIAASQWLAAREIALTQVDKFWKIQLLNR